MRRHTDQTTSHEQSDLLYFTIKRERCSHFNFTKREGGSQELAALQVGGGSYYRIEIVKNDLKIPAKRQEYCEEFDINTLNHFAPIFSSREKVGIDTPQQKKKAL